MDNGRIGRINPILKIRSLDHLPPRVFQDVSKEMPIMFALHSFEEKWVQVTGRLSVPYKEQVRIADYPGSAHVIALIRCHNPLRSNYMTL